MTTDARGGLVAAALAGAWRRNPPPPVLSAGELEQIAPLLLGAGCGGLAWGRIRGSPVAGSAVGEQLREAYRLHELQAAVHEAVLARVVRTLDAAGIDALIVKGWTAARLYAQPGLRPYGDLDVCVSAEQHDAARAALADPALPIDVDLHYGLGINSGMARDLPSFEEAWGELRTRASTVSTSGSSPPKTSSHCSASTCSRTARGARSGSVTSPPPSSSCRTGSIGVVASVPAAGARRG